MFPYRDENETQRTAIVTLTMIALNVFAWLFVQGAGSTLALAQLGVRFWPDTRRTDRIDPPRYAISHGRGACLRY